MKHSVWMLALVAQAASAQGDSGRPCAMIVDDLPETSSFFQVRGPTGKFTSWFGGGFRARCAGTTMRVTSDSAEFYEEQSYILLIGRARYTEDSTSVDADRISYYETSSYLDASGDVTVRNGERVTLTARQVTYFRVIPDVRPFTSAVAFGRPRLILKDSTAANADSTGTVIDADRLYMDRDSLYAAGGDVVVTRVDLVATTDSLETDITRELARLLTGSPRIEGTGTRTFTLEGRQIDVFGKERQVERMFAKGEAVAVSDSLRLTSDTLDIRMTATVMDSVHAFGPGRARAVAPSRDVVADELFMFMPGERIDHFIAVGRAYIATAPDTAVRSSERDWIEGDTVVAWFERSALSDTAADPVIRELIARGNARSFFQLASRDAVDSLPAVNYVGGARIDVAFASGEVQEVRVTGQVFGLYLEPARATAPAMRKPPPPPRPPAPLLQ